MKTAIFTATIAFIAAMVAQWVSHRFSIKREDKKYNKEIVQEFILPNLPEILLYIDTETNFRKGHDVEIEVQQEEVIDNIFKKVRYVNNDILNALFDYRNSTTYFDGRGEAKNLAILKVFYLFLDYSVKVMGESGFDDKYLMDKINKRLKLYGVTYCLTDLLGWEKTIELLQWNWAWESSVYDKISTHILEKILKRNEMELETIQHERLQIITIIEDGFKYSDVNDTAFLFDYIKEARDCAKRFY